MKKEAGFNFSKFIFSVLFNTAVLLVALLVFVPFFEEIDDTQICMIAEGAFGKREWHLIYENFILGKLYVVLGQMFSQIRWHIVLQYAFIFIGYVFLVYVLSKHKRGLVASIVLVLASFYELYVSIQYTKTAAFVCVVGFVLIFESVRNSTDIRKAMESVLAGDNKKSLKESILLLAIAFFLIVYGSLLRPESFFIACVPTVSVGFLELLRTKNIKKYILLFIPLFAVVMLLKYTDSAVYSSDEAWSYFMKYNRSRMELNDYRYDILDFNKYSDKLNSLNVTENDALAILTYQYGDDTVFSYERFKEIREAFESKALNYSVFANLFENLVNEVGRSLSLVLGLVSVIIMLLASIITDRSKSSPGFIKDSTRKLISMLGIGVCCSAAIIYFQYSGRYSHRLIGALVIPTMVVCVYMIDSIYIKDNDSKIIFGGNKNDLNIPLTIVFSIILLAVNGHMYVKNIADYNDNVTETTQVLRELDEISHDKESLYVADTFTFQNVYKYQVFNTFEVGKLENFITCGSWYLNSPVTKPDTLKFGYENPYEALKSGADNVYLLDNLYPECKTLFLNEHYDNVYVAEKIDKRGGIDVYRVVKSED